MKLSMPILAFVVALLLVASQGIYTVDQRKYAIKFQLGEVIAEHRPDEDVVAPPILGVDERRADRGPRIAGQEVGEREIDGPRQRDPES